INSTPSSLARIMRFTALPPPPPTPMTLIFAGCSSSLKLIRIPASLVVISSPSLLQFRLRLSGRVTRRRRTWLSILIQSFPSAAARSVAPSRHTERVRLRLHIPAAPPVPADQPSLLVPRCAPADGTTPRQVPATREAARRRPPRQIRRGFGRQARRAANRRGSAKAIPWRAAR